MLQISRDGGDYHLVWVEGSSGFDEWIAGPYEDESDAKVVLRVCNTLLRRGYALPAISDIMSKVDVTPDPLYVENDSRWLLARAAARTFESGPDETVSREDLLYDVGGEHEFRPEALSRDRYRPDTFERLLRTTRGVAPKVMDAISRYERGEQ